MPNTTYGRSMGRNPRRRYHGKYVTKNYLKAIVGVPEVKWVNSVLPPTPVPDTGIIGNLNLGISPGTGESARIGNEVTNKSLHMRLDIARGAVDSLLRIIIFWYLDGIEISSPTPATILETVSYQSPLNKTNGKSFWVKFDKTYTIAAGQTQLQVDEIWRKLKCKTEYAESDNPTNNSLHILYISNQSTTANQPIFSYTNRLNYLDV